MMNKKKMTSVFLAVVLMVGLPYSTMAKKATLKKPVEVQYVALGDSLAAGQTPTGFIDYGYPDYVADKFTGKKYKLVDYDNFGIPGYTTVKLKNDVLNSAKIKKEMKQATHITIDIGANDFLSILKTNPEPTLLLSAIGEVGMNIDTILSTIDELNPKAKVYVMGYYNPFAYYPAEQQQALLPVLTNVNTTIASVAKKHGDTYVATEKIVADKYKEYLPNAEDIHLSKTGYKAVANEFWKKINK